MSFISGVSNAGANVISTGLQTAAAITIATLQYDTYRRAADQQFEIAKQIQKRADELHEIWKTSYLPCELETLREICSEPKYEPQFALESRRANAEIVKQFSLTRQQALYCLTANCVGQTCDTDRKIATSQARAVAWQVQAAIRQETARKDLKDAQRLNNRILMINPGRNGVAQAQSSLASAARLYDRVAQQSAAGFNGAAAVAGRLLGGLNAPTPPRNAPLPPVEDRIGTPVEPPGMQGDPNFDSRRFDPAPPPSRDFDTYDDYNFQPPPQPDPVAGTQNQTVTDLLE